jgi:hypothetical protein
VRLRQQVVLPSWVRVGNGSRKNRIGEKIKNLEVRGWSVAQVVAFLPGEPKALQ